MSTMIHYWLLLLLLQNFCSAHNNNNSNSNPSEILKYHVAAPLYRAKNLRGGINNVKVPLRPRGYGDYSMSVCFGSPPQNLSLMLDTGSSLTWFPCTFQKHNFSCTKCDAQGVDPAHDHVFLPEKSSSYKIVPCDSTQCRWLFPDLQCRRTEKSCEYTIPYWIGNSTGLLLNETLAFGASKTSVAVHNFTVGCSVSASYSPEGVVGFGRGLDSLPSQMGLKGFIYCMVSHDLDDHIPAVTSDLVLMRTSDDDYEGGNNKFQYTPLLKNPLKWSEYYYVGLQSIYVDGVDIKVPKKYLVPDVNGNGGTILDSGTTFTMMEEPVFDLLFKEFKRKVGNKYTRNKRAENQTDVELCYDIGRKNKTSITLPQLAFTFQGGVKMVLPLENYFMYADKQRSVLCMTIVNGGAVEPGPAITLGNYQQQNYYIKYDLEKNLLGIRHQKCYQKPRQ